MKICGKSYGKGIGGVVRICQRHASHAGPCSDMPFLIHMRSAFRKVAAKIERDSFQTRGASWGRNLEGQQARRNRQPRWTLKPGDSFYPKHHQTYQVCLVIAAQLTLQAYEMEGAPDCPSEDSIYLPRNPSRGSSKCPVCRLPLTFGDFLSAAQSIAVIDTDHLDPALERRHVPGNVSFVHHLCNTTKGNRSLDQFMNWMIGVLERCGLNVVKPT